MSLEFKSQQVSRSEVQHAPVAKVEPQLPQTSYAHLAELNSVSMPSRSVARSQQEEIPVSASLANNPKSQKEQEGPALATIGEKVGQDFSNILQDRRSQSGFVVIAKSIFKFILDFFVR